MTVATRIRDWNGATDPEALRRPPRRRLAAGVPGFVLAALVLAAGMGAASPLEGQMLGWQVDRPAAPALADVPSPVVRVVGEPGRLTLQPAPCRSTPTAHLRERIVEVAIREWIFFGVPVLDRVAGTRLLPPGLTGNGTRPDFQESRGWPGPLEEAEAVRVAASIAGYWAVTPEGSGIVADQNRFWSQAGLGARWRSPWSAAFISWVMCEAGLETRDEFHRAIAHWRYVDQAIRARDGAAPRAAYVAYELGEAVVEPGDMVCRARRPVYRTVAQRRAQMGSGASSHCDIVVAVDVEGGRILGIGGNVLRSVGLKVLAGERHPDGGLTPVSTPGSPLFAHLKLRADPVPSDALTRSPTLQAALTGPGGRFLGERLTVISRELGLDLSTPPTSAPVAGTPVEVMP